jgi:hypothetical protein
VRLRRWFSTIRWSVFSALAVLVAALLGGCAEPKAPEVLVGTFTMFNRQSPYLIAAPHGEYDNNTDEVVYEFCERVRWDCLVAEGFRNRRTMINVNRPTAGAKLRDTRFTDSAADVYSQYVSRIRRLSPRVAFYAEIHGHEHAKLPDVIDIATVGISPEQAKFIYKTLKVAMVDQGLGHLELRIDVLESIHYKATHARRFGVLSFLSPAVHVELPHDARNQLRPQLVAALVAALPEIAAALFPSGAEVLHHSSLSPAARD